uniref:SUMO1/sentrin specific protease 1 n=1 Tax=Apis cerana TaxID=7461 RepID=V9IJ01_APICE
MAILIKIFGLCATSNCFLTTIMLLFDFLKKFFGWVDEAPRKRRAVSFSLEKEFVTPKKHRCDYKTINVEEEPIEIKDDSDEDEVQVITKHKYPSIKASSKLNGTCNNSREKSLTCCSSSFSSSKSQPCYDKVNIGCSNKSGRIQNIESHQQCSTLIKTHRLREKNQYEELLQNFLPRRIHVICDKNDDKRSTQEPIEVIDLERSSSSTPFSKTQSASRKHDRMLQMHWNTSIKEKKKIQEIINLDNDEKEEPNTFHS